MKDKIKTNLMKFAVLPMIVAAIMIVAYYSFFWWNFVFISKIEMERFNGRPYRMNIPVRYVDRHLTSLKGEAIHAKGNYRYSLRKDDAANTLWITVSRLELGGLAAFTARYEITDQEIKKKLLDLWNNCANERFDK